MVLLAPNCSLLAAVCCLEHDEREKMIISNLASRLLRPFANAGAKATIPVSQTDATRASYEQGFPALNMTPIAAGGVPPSGQDFNGVLYDLSNAALWQQAAGILPWDAGFAQSPVSGGYPKNALVVHNAVLYQSSVDNNTETPGAGTNWQGVGVSNASQPQHAVTQQQMQDGLAQHTHPYAPLASPALTGNPTAPTAPQFDNDTSIATTAFVQRAAGSLYSFVSYTGGKVLEASDVGRPIQIFGAGAMTVTLPLASACPSGSVITLVVSDAGAIVNIEKQGSNVFAFGTPAPLRHGDSIQFVSNGVDIWWSFNGTNHNQKSSGMFGSSLSNSGYQKLPSGLIIQWGSLSTSNTNGTVTFPTAFPNACFSVVVHDYSSAVSDNSIVRLNLPTNTQVSWFGQTYTGSSIFPSAWTWIAIGY